VAVRIGALQKSFVQYPNIKPGQEFEGYSSAAPQRRKPEQAAE